jgi:hypothetical protein
VYEAYRPLPYVKFLDYASWSLLQYKTDKTSLRKAFDKLAALPDAEYYRRQALMLHTAEQLTMTECSGQPGLHYLLASLTLDRHELADIQGHAWLRSATHVKDL